MAYTHSGKRPVVMTGSPADPDGTDWVFFSYAGWLRQGETITSHAAAVVGGTLVTDSVYLGTIPDASGESYDEVYGMQFKPDANTSAVTITHRVSTTTSGAELARLDMDHSVTIPVKTL